MSNKKLKKGDMAEIIKSNKVYGANEGTIITIILDDGTNHMPYMFLINGLNFFGGTKPNTSEGYIQIKKLEVKNEQ